MNTRSEPWGLGVYYRALGGTPPEEMARRAADHGIRHALLLAAWQQVKAGTFSCRLINGPQVIARYADAFAAEGIHPALWFYPWGGYEQRLLDHLKLVIEVCGGTIRGLLPDPEVGCKWKREGGRHPKMATSNMRGQPEAIAARGSGAKSAREDQAMTLMTGLLELMTEGMWFGVTSYGIPQFHPNFPWDVFLSYGVLSAQLYGATPREVTAGMDQWRRLAGDLHSEREYVPSVAAYGDTDEELLEPTLESWTGQPIQGMFVWSEPQISRGEWKTLLKIAQKWGWA